MDTHVKVLGWLNMIFGALALVVPIAVLINSGGFSGLFAAFNEDLYGFLAVAAVVFNLAMAIPAFIGGFFIRKLIDSIKTMLILVSAVNMLNVPFGTLLGAYGLWVLMLPETDPLFANAPAQRKKKKPIVKVPKTTASSTVTASSDISSK